MNSFEKKPEAQMTGHGHQHELKGMKIMKKTRLFSMLSAAAVTTAMLTTGLTAGAVTMPTDGVMNITSTTEAPNTILFYKDIVIHNEEKLNGEYVTQVYGPSITYEYEIAPAQGAELSTITDANGKTVTAKKGPDNGVKMQEGNKTAVFTSKVIKLTNGVGTDTDSVGLKVDPDSFTGAGVYRYKITEKDSGGARKNASITRDETKYSAERYLDVYVKNGTDGLEITGYVMFHKGNSETTPMVINGTTENNTTGNKTDGYDSDDQTNESSSSGTSTQDMADHYYTYNYDVTKEITGALADKTHQFPFTVNTSQPEGSTAGKTFYVTKNETAIDDDASTGTITQDVSQNLADGETLYLIGLAANTSITKVMEENDTADTYKSVAENPLVQSKSVAANATFGFDSTAADATVTPYALTNYAEDTNSKPTANSAITDTKFTNSLEDISPTGVVLTVAPYAIMLGIAVFFVAVFIRNKKKDEYENTI